MLKKLKKDAKIFICVPDQEIQGDRLSAEFEVTFLSNNYKSKQGN